MSMGSVHMQQPLFAHTAPFYSEDDGGVAISAAISGTFRGDLWGYMVVYGYIGVYWGDVCWVSVCILCV